MAEKWPRVVSGHFMANMISKNGGLSYKNEGYHNQLKLRLNQFWAF